jgi:hypothetical protein
MTTEAKLIINTCKQCGWQWAQHRTLKVNPAPLSCPHCRSKLWGRSRKSMPCGENFKKAIELRKATPCLTLQQIGDKLGVTRERVRQLLNKGEMPTKHYHYNSKLHCAKCGKKLFAPSKSGLCQGCWASPLVPLICDQCGKLFYRRQLRILNPRQPHTGFYCSKQCYGVHFGTHYGGGHKKELVVR